MTGVDLADFGRAGVAEDVVQRLAHREVERVANFRRHLEVFEFEGKVELTTDAAAVQEILEALPKRPVARKRKR